MAPCSTFLDFPRELRDVIYEQYFTSDGGYIFDYNTKRFRRTSGTTIDVHLTQTCRLIANETRGLAFKLNSLHFSTVYQDDKREIFGHFSVLLATLIFHKTEHLKDATYEGHFDEAACSNITAAHPKFEEVIEKLRDGSLAATSHYHDWKVAHSIGRQFIIDALRALAAQSRYKEGASPTQYWIYPEKEFGDMLSLWCDPWTIPTEETIAGLTAAIPVQENIEASWVNSSGYWAEQQYRLSAASIAIRFMQRLPGSLGLHIRKIILHEDRVAIAWPECHAQGLIPFCQENPHLQIERRVSLWRNIFPSGSPSLCQVIYGTDSDDYINDRSELDNMTGLRVSRCLSRWLKEALALQDMGMPYGAFTFTLQCDAIPDRTREVFELVKSDAAWQTAFKACWNDKDLDSEPPALYISFGFPEVIKGILDGTSLVKLDFDLDDSCDVDVEELIARGKSWDEEDWDEHWWESHHHVRFEPEAPLPCTWLELRKEDLLPTADISPAQRAIFFEY
jgi:hypothetical protein